jgi:hypothetical protein
MNGLLPLNNTHAVPASFEDYPLSLPRHELLPENSITTADPAEEFFGRMLPQ